MTPLANRCTRRWTGLAARSIAASAASLPLRIPCQITSTGLSEQQERLRDVAFGKVGAVDHAPGDMLGHETGLNSPGDPPDAFEMRRIEALEAAKRETDAMQ